MTFLQPVGYWVTGLGCAQRRRSSRATYSLRWMYVENISIFTCADRCPVTGVRSSSYAVREILGGMLHHHNDVSRLTTTLKQYDPTNSAAWIKYAELETALEDFGRAEAIFELGVSQSSLSMPEILWKAYVDFEIDEQGDREKARSLYERLISLSGHHKVWISYAEFEGSSVPLPRAMREEEEEEDAEPRMVAGDPILAREVFERGYKDLRSRGLKAEVGLRRLSSRIK